MYAAPDAGVDPVNTLSMLTEYLLPRTLLAFDQYQDWLHVYLPTRPNSSTGWIKRSDVGSTNSRSRGRSRSILAERQADGAQERRRRLRGRRRDRTAEYPTPTGTFYFTDPLDLTTGRAPGTACSRSACRAIRTCSPSSAVATARSRSTAPTTRATSARRLARLRAARTTTHPAPVDAAARHSRLHHLIEGCARSRHREGGGGARDHRSTASRATTVYVYVPAGATQNDHCAADVVGHTAVEPDGPLALTPGPETSTEAARSLDHVSTGASGRT